MHIVAAGSDIVAKELDHEVIIVNMTTGIYYSLNSTGSYIWSHSEAGATLADIRSRMEKAYAGSAGRDFDRFIETLVSSGLVVKAADAMQPGADSSAALPEAYEIPELHAYDDVAAMIALDPPLPEIEQYKKASN